MGPDKRVLIVGGGIAGLSLGRALKLAGVDIDIVERVATWSPAGAGIYIPANGMRALRQLGLDELLISRGRVNTRRRYLTSKGRTSFEIDLVDFWDGTGPCLGVTRTALHEVLLAGVDGVPVRLGTTVSRLTEDVRGVGVVFHDGSQERYDLVVGADGIRSSVRGLIADDHVLGRADLASVNWRFLVRCPSAIDCWTVFVGAEAMVLIVPVGQNRAYCWAALTARRPVPRRPDAQWLRSAFQDFSDPVPDVMNQIDESVDLHYSPIDEVIRPTWGRGEVVLIGDAAHAMPPTMAQGAALAVEDALVLADLLRAGSDWSDVTTRLASRRDGRIAWIREHTSRQARLVNLPYPLRKLAMRVVGEKLWRRSFAPLREPIG